MDISPLKDAIQHYEDGMITAYELWNKVAAWHVSQDVAAMKLAHEIVMNNHEITADLED